MRRRHVQLCRDEAAEQDGTQQRDIVTTQRFTACTFITSSNFLAIYGFDKTDRVARYVRS